MRSAPRNWRRRVANWSCLRRCCGIYLRRDTGCSYSHRWPACWTCWKTSWKDTTGSTNGWMDPLLELWGRLASIGSMVGSFTLPVRNTCWETIYLISYFTVFRSAIFIGVSLLTLKMNVWFCRSILVLHTEINNICICFEIADISVDFQYLLKLLLFSKSCLNLD